MTIDQQREIELALINFIKKATDANASPHEIEQIANVVSALVLLAKS